MSYADQMEQEIISAITIATGEGAALTAAADIGVFVPGLQPVEIRGVGIVVTTTATVTAPVVNFYSRPDASNDAGRVLIHSLTAPLANWIEGNVIYEMLNENAIIRPGGDFIAEVATTATAGNGHVTILFNPSWEMPVNNTNMINGTG